MEIKRLTTNNKLLSGVRKIASAREFTVLILVVLAVLFMSTTNQYFLQPSNLRSVLLGLSADGILAVAITFACISGVFDFSIGAIMGFSGMMTAVLSNRMNVWLAALIALIACVCIGFINGLLIGKIRLNALIASLGMQKVVHGLTYIVSNGMPVRTKMTDSFANLAQGKVLGLQHFIWIFLAIAIIAELLLRYTTPLRKLYYTGSNEKGAIFSGINTVLVKVSVYVTTAALSALTGILYISRFSTASPDNGIGAEMTCISAAVIGGASIKGGEGSVLGTFFGIILMKLLNNALVLYRLDVYWQTFCEGLVLMAAILIDYVIHASREKKRLKSTN